MNFFVLGKNGIDKDCALSYDQQYINGRYYIRWKALDLSFPTVQRSFKMDICNQRSGRVLPIALFSNPQIVGWKSTKILI